MYAVSILTDALESFTLATPEGLISPSKIEKPTSVESLTWYSSLATFAKWLLTVEPPLPLKSLIPAPFLDEAGCCQLVT